MESLLIDTVTIHLKADCSHASCRALADRIHLQLDTPGYTRGVSLMRCPDSRADWQADHRTARKRAWRAERLGYRFAEVDMAQYDNDRWAINASKQERQGRPMAPGYLTRARLGSLPAYPCDRHKIHTFGVLWSERLYAYMTLYRVGELGLVSMILGHGDHLRDDIMYLLFAGMVEQQAGMGGWFYYNRHDSGTDGLRYYKERIGFREADIGWALA